MKKSTFIIGCFLLAGLLSTDLYAQSDRSVPSDAKSVKNPYAGDESATRYGAKVYKKYCWICHGTNGAGDGPGSTSLSTKPASFNEEVVLNRTDGELFWWITNGGENMQPFGDVLSDEQIWKTVNYIRSLQKK